VTSVVRTKGWSARMLTRRRIVAILRGVGLAATNGRTLSGVTRRVDVPRSSDVERQVTFDRAVWTKPLACAADAVSSAMSFQSCGPRMSGYTRRRRRSDRGGGDAEGARDREAVVIDPDRAAHLRRPRERARPGDSWRTEVAATTCHEGCRREAYGERVAARSDAR
jgi:hypothetical protein